jgi:hypothetical protein
MTRSGSHIMPILLRLVLVDIIIQHAHDKIRMHLTHNAHDWTLCSFFATRFLPIFSAPRLVLAAVGLAACIALEAAAPALVHGRLAFGAKHLEFHGNLLVINLS